ncbi:hypothetical protein AVEN_63924-1 [Araneus ventricosus]|uniref:Uncharacterized protein n=1 Tax=Araneus ventricosus TaxID=182803 RepID=A0A4Y2HZA2_ARAVE|nr:hypothetical protein AVEN_63924-1 [Araneus ventricosus]
MTRRSKLITNEVGFSNFSTTTVQFSSDNRIDDGVRSDSLQMALNGVAVNVQLQTSRPVGYPTFRSNSERFFTMIIGIGVECS